MRTNGKTIEASLPLQTETVFTEMFGLMCYDTVAVTLTLQRFAAAIS